MIGGANRSQEHFADVYFIDLTTHKDPKKAKSWKAVRGLPKLALR